MKTFKMYKLLLLQTNVAQAAGPKVQRGPDLIQLVLTTSQGCGV